MDSDRPNQTTPTAQDAIKTLLEELVSNPRFFGLKNSEVFGSFWILMQLLLSSLCGNDLVSAQKVLMDTWVDLYPGCIHPREGEFFVPPLPLSVATSSDLDGLMRIIFQVHDLSLEKIRDRAHRINLLGLL